MQLSRLLGDVQVRSVRGDPERVVITAVTDDSERVVPGALFCCVPGARVDGHAFAARAVAAGARALLVEREVDVDVAQVVVDDTRLALAVVAAALYDNPSARMQVVGVTGTNGKTTTTHLLAGVLEAAGRRAAVIGTLSGANSRSGRGPGTTPAAPDLQAHLAELAGEGFDSVAMEVSSHALVQHRVDGIRFAVAVFTNLSHDHLEFHGTMEDYYLAKASLFAPQRAGVAVVNADDPWGRRLLAEVGLAARSFSLGEARDLDVGRTGSRFTWEGQPVHLRLPGRVNVANALAAAAAARELGIEPAVIAGGLSGVASVRGRNEAVERGQPFTVLVDYAHTPDALEHALAGARAMAAGAQVRVVFGCGGDRDRAKRPLMGEVATRLADLAVLTSDNPRGEDPLAIIAEVRAGAHDRALVVEPDRRAAIELALRAAGPGDVVVIAGKGHETTQAVGDQVVPFDDKAVAAELLGQLLAEPRDRPEAASAGPGAVRPQAGTTAGGGGGAPTASEESGVGTPDGQKTWSRS